MNNRWRTIDIVIASIIAVAFGVIFWAWNLLWNGPADAIPLPGRAVIYGMWLVPAVLGALIVRKPGRGVLHADRWPRWSRSRSARAGAGPSRCRARSRRSAPSSSSRSSRTASTGCRWRCSRRRWPGWWPSVYDAFVWYPRHLVGDHAAPVHPDHRGVVAGDRRPRQRGAGQGAGPDRRAGPLRGRPGAGAGLSRMSEVVLRGFGWRHAGPPRLGGPRRRPAHRARRAGAAARALRAPARAPCSPRWPACCPTTRASPAGTVEVDGLDPRKARERVGILFQDPQTQLVMARSGDDVAFGLENRGVPAGHDLAAGQRRPRPGRLPVPDQPLDRRALRRRGAAPRPGRGPRAAPGPAAARRADREPRPGRRGPGPRRDRPVPRRRHHADHRRTPGRRGAAAGRSRGGARAGRRDPRRRRPRGGVRRLRRPAGRRRRLGAGIHHAAAQVAINPRPRTGTRPAN